MELVLQPDSYGWRRLAKNDWLGFIPREYPPKYSAIFIIHRHLQQLNEIMNSEWFDEHNHDTRVTVGRMRRELTKLEEAFANRWGYEWWEDTT